MTEVLLFFFVTDDKW